MSGKGRRLFAFEVRSRHNLPTQHMTWWFWIVLGLGLSALELATPGGIVIVFFGVAALVVGLLALANIAGPAWVQWLLFPIFALISLRLFRQPVMNRLGIGGERSDVDTLVGEIAVVVEPMLPNGHGRAELRGTTWSARNAGSVPLLSGQRCRVVAVQGLMLDLRSE
jgi:membrane protein implicated in regulation of membrane protease activity